MGPPARVSKRVFLGGQVCPTRAWFLRHAPPQPLDPGEELRLREGNEVGERARRLFPEGILIDDRDLLLAAEKTARLMADDRVKVIFEATFLAGSYVARADIIIREPNGWQVNEVKSNLNLHDGLIEDIAYTVNVARHAGIPISSSRLMLLSPNYRCGMSDENLFQYSDVTGLVASTIERFRSIWDEVPGYIEREQPIAPQLVWACRSCELFESDCIGTNADKHVFNLPYLREPTFRRLLNLNVTSIDKIPEGFPLSQKQHRVWRAVTTDKAIVEKAELSRLMATVKYPAYYLDFETVKTAIPVLADLRPHASIVTQYSLHRRAFSEHEGDHFQYLADHQRDCRRELAERLLKDLGAEGTIMVYSGYEERMLNQLAQLFPDLANAIKGCIKRLFDLRTPFENWVCHPACAGSTSIKATLPAFCDVDYSDLEVQNGDTAIAYFVRLMKGEVSPNQIQSMRSALLAYCKRDTLAMIKLHDALLELCE